MKRFAAGAWRIFKGFPPDLLAAPFAVGFAFVRRRPSAEAPLPAGACRIFKALRLALLAIAGLELARFGLDRALNGVRPS